MAANTQEDIELMRAMGERIRELSQKRGMKNPRDIARAMLGENDGPDVENLGSNLSAIMRGRHMPRITLLLRIADAIGVTASDILGDSKRKVRNADEERAWSSGYRAAVVDMQEQLTELRRRENGR